MTTINKRTWNAHDYLSRSMAYLKILQDDNLDVVNYTSIDVREIHNLLTSADRDLEIVWGDNNTPAIASNIFRKEMRISAARKIFKADDLIDKKLRVDGISNVRFHLYNALSQLIA